jgi:lipoprotein Spr
VNRIYEQVYCILLPGNSSQMATQVTKVPKSDLREGDLVFFKINRRSISHVGVYLGNDKFAHASRTKGVIVSDLNHPYYKKYFVKGGRVNFPVN